MNAPGLAPGIFTLVTMGLGVLVINALLFLFVGHLVTGFAVSGFWSAFGGALVVSVTNWIVSAFTRSGKPRERPPAEPKAKRDDAIDI